MGNLVIPLKLFAEYTGAACAETSVGGRTVGVGVRVGVGVAVAVGDGDTGLVTAVATAVPDTGGGAIAVADNDAMNPDDVVLWNGAWQQGAVGAGRVRVPCACIIGRGVTRKSYFNGPI